MELLAARDREVGWLEHHKQEAAQLAEELETSRKNVQSQRVNIETLQARLVRTRIS